MTVDWPWCGRVKDSHEILGLSNWKSGVATYSDGKTVEGESKVYVAAVVLIVIRRGGGHRIRSLGLGLLSLRRF